MAADNDLAAWADSDLVEMEAIGSQDESVIIVQLDKPYIGARRLFIEQGTSSELQDLGIIDMCDWHELADFIIWGMSQYPAKRYCVILWDHGSGWTVTPSRSFGSDWSGGSEMSIAHGDFRNAIQTAHNYTGEKIDLLAFDACLMQQIEVAYEIYDIVSMFLAPEIVCPIQGFRYDSIFTVLNAQPSMREAEFARQIIDITIRHYTGTVPVVYTAIDVRSLRAFRETCDRMTEMLLNTEPSGELKAIRQNVQTIPPSGYTPSSEHDIVDIGDFLQKMNDVLNCPESQQLLDSYEALLHYSRSWGDDFNQSTGLAVWFPDVYQQFKQGIQAYTPLLWAQSKWLVFLNWFYDADDIRPTSVSLHGGAIGDNNDFQLTWSTSYDLAPVLYQLIEAQDTVVVFEDMCEDSVQWNFNGFMVSSDNHYSGTSSFFSGNGSNLYNFVETKTPVIIEEYGLLICYLYISTEDMTDSLIIQYGTFKDVHYGFSDGWQKRQVIVPGGSEHLIISYRTNETINRGGCYIDDIRLQALSSGRIVRYGVADTSLYIFNHERGSYMYILQPEDYYGNTSNVSNYVSAIFNQYATPFSRPNPFQESCEIMLDYPDSLSPTIDIFSISGRKVKTFTSNMIHNHSVFWDARDEHGKEVGAGLYFVFVHDGSFKKIGKIARQR